MKNAIKISAASMLSFALVLSAVTAFAASDSKSIKSVTNDFEPAKMGIAVQEDVGRGWDNNSDPTPAENEMTWQEDGENYTATKKVQILNRKADVSNPAPAFIRVCIIPRWTAEIGGEEFDVTNIDGISDMNAFTKDISGNTCTIGGVTFILADDWEKNWIHGGDGYFYCRTAVEPGSSTPVLLKKVSVTAETYKIAKELGAELTVDVLADSIQTEGQDSGETSALAERWGAPEILGIQVDKDSGGSPILKEYSGSQEEGGDKN